MVCPLPEIVVLLPCATLAGADDIVEILLCGERYLEFCTACGRLSRIGASGKPEAIQSAVRFCPWTPCPSMAWPATSLSSRLIAPTACLQTGHSQSLIMPMVTMA